MNRLNKILNMLKKEYPSYERTTLNRMRKKPDSFKILISCLLSLRTQDVNTEKVSEKLFKVADTPEKIASISLNRLEKLIFSSGYYKKKARVLKHMSRELIKRFDSKVPDDKEKLLSIKGIGPKTANIVLAFVFGKQVIPVDVHVHVVANRLGWVKTKYAEKTEKELERVIPKKYWRDLNAILVQHGKELCVTFSPKCSVCFLDKLCPKIGVKRKR